MLLLCCIPLLSGFFGIEDDPVDEAWKEGESFEMPPPPNYGDLLEVDIGGSSSNTFLIEKGTLSVDRKMGGIVRYVLVARSRGGAQNVTYEGIFCGKMERRIYASWHETKQEWVPMKNSHWQKLASTSFNNPRVGLAYGYLCDGPAPPRNVEEALKSLHGKRSYIDPRGR